EHAFNNKSDKADGLILPSLSQFSYTVCYDPLTLQSEFYTPQDWINAREDDPVQLILQQQQ
ncbi:MAG: hypothetical protein FWF59_00245, partial [Turicibacter sp.]|nr:hypothetical protein [Turicibacter sp.]